QQEQDDASLGEEDSMNGSTSEEDGVEPVELRVEAPENDRETELEDLRARLRTVSAAYQNQKNEITETQERLKRQAQFKEQAIRGEVVGTLFEPVQNLRRSIDAIQSGSSAEDAIAGLELVVQQIMNGFRSLGLEEVPGKGTRFDPNLHEAIGVVPVLTDDEDGIIVEVFSAGYCLGTRLVQPAQVVIGKLQESMGEA
ncbi:MAG: nucleotide exchange factor GrpE, partial [Myxococcota bacterium]|nr:nucleotide exchange factor GrpE [Myxococcota bacterium]